jgi:hypothetical protein
MQTKSLKRFMMQSKGIQMVDEMTYLVALADPVV